MRNVMVLGLLVGLCAMGVARAEDLQAKFTQVASQKLNEQMGALVIQNIQLAAQVELLRGELEKAQKAGGQDATEGDKMPIPKPLTAK